METFDIDPCLADMVRRLAGEAATTDFVVLLAAVQLWLHEQSGERRFHVAVPVSNRRSPAVEGVAGPFANIIVVPADLRGALSFRDLLVRVRETIRQVWERRHVPFELLADTMTTVGAERSRLCRFMFGVQNIPEAAEALTGLTVTPLTLDRETGRFDLWMRCHETSAGLSGQLEYSTALFDADTVRRRIDAFLTMLRQGVRNPDLPICAAQPPTPAGLR